MSFAKWPENAAIHELQIMLRTVDSAAGLNVDGIYGPETETAVRNFQTGTALPVTGVVDQDTWEAIRSAYETELIFLGKAAPLEIVLQPNQVLEKGSENLHLYIIQAMFLALGRLLTDVPSIRVTGILDAETAAAVLWLQNRGGLKETGEIDKQTWRFLVRQYRSTIGDGTGTFPYRINPQGDDLPRGTPSQDRAEPNGG